MFIETRGFGFHLKEVRRRSINISPLRWGQQAKLVATNATVMVFKDTGHWLMEERPKETMDALVKFLFSIANRR